MSEFTPVTVIETYSKDPTYDHLEDNNRVHMSGMNFKSYIPCNPEPGCDISFYETPNRPLPEALKDGRMMISDVWAVIAVNPAMDHLI